MDAIKTPLDASSAVAHNVLGHEESQNVHTAKSRGNDDLDETTAKGKKRKSDTQSDQLVNYLHAKDFKKAKHTSDDSTETTTTPDKTISVPNAVIPTILASKITKMTSPMVETLKDETIDSDVAINKEEAPSTKRILEPEDLTSVAGSQTKKQTDMSPSDNSRVDAIKHIPKKQVKTSKKKKLEQTTIRKKVTKASPLSRFPTPKSSTILSAKPKLFRDPRVYATKKPAPKRHHNPSYEENIELHVKAYL